MNKRVFLSTHPYGWYFKEMNKSIPAHEVHGKWPCNWIGCPGGDEKVYVAAYRKFFTAGAPIKARVHVSADERYELYIDGVRIGRGSERGDQNNWFFESFDLEFPEGEHVIVARVWSFGHMRPDAQITVFPGFIFSPEEEEYIGLLGTGTSAWDVKKLGRI